LLDVAPAGFLQGMADPFPFANERIRLERKQQNGFIRMRQTGADKEDREKKESRES